MSSAAVVTSTLRVKVNVFSIQGSAAVLQRRTEGEEQVEVGRLSVSDYFGKSSWHLDISKLWTAFGLIIFISNFFSTYNHLYKKIIGLEQKHKYL